MSVIITFEITAHMPWQLSPDDNFPVEMDISSFLGDDTISSVAYTATDEDGVTATTTIIDSTRCVNTDTTIIPYIKTGGTSGKSYKIKMVVTTAANDDKAFYLRWVCGE